jgi:hypothetical protein
MQTPKTGVKTKYDNKFMVSYPTPVYLEARKWANRKGLSIQDMQRKAMDFYVNHLNHDQNVFTKDDSDKRTKNITDDGKRKYLTQR